MLKKTALATAAVIAAFALIIGMITILPYTQTAAFAAKIEGDEGPNFLIGTPGNDRIDSKGGNDENLGDTFEGDGSGNDKINSGTGDDFNLGDTFEGDGSGNDKINSGTGDDVNFGDTAFGTGSGNDKINAGQGNDELTGSGGADKFQCGSGEDTVTDLNEEEGDKATGNCENI